MCTQNGVVRLKAAPAKLLFSLLYGRLATHLRLQAKQMEGHQHVLSFGARWHGSAAQIYQSLIGHVGIAGPRSVKQADTGRHDTSLNPVRV